MKRTGIAPIVVLFSSGAFHVGSADWKVLRGTYAITPKNYLDPSQDEPKDSYLRVRLSGETARELYFAMKVAEQPDECTGAIGKRVGSMQCVFYEGEKRYACHFAVDIMQQKIEYGVAC